MKFDSYRLLKKLEEECYKVYGCDILKATKPQIYRVVCSVVLEMLQSKRSDFSAACESDGAKQLYYFSVEFLIGRSLKNNLYNLGLEQVFEATLHDVGISLSDLYETEPDAGLGNGGLGRLAACYMDSLTTLAVPATGFSICYEFGIFQQKIVDGWQVEFPDDWLGLGDVWLVPRRDRGCEVHFGGKIEEKWEDGRFNIYHYDYETVIAMPYDMLISGYKTNAVNSLVLWTAKSPQLLDMDAFSRGEYQKALESKNDAEVISKILYPADDHYVGKILRLKQQYLLVSASLQTIVGEHVKKYGDLTSLPQKAAVHINDTHTSMSVAELMRILMDEYGFLWEEAWDITGKTLAYTNHTVMGEALERWPEQLFMEQLPRVYQIIKEINRRTCEMLYGIFPDDHLKVEYMAVIAKGEIRMANLCLCCCHKVNGVSALHTEILKTGLFKDYNTVFPEKFINVTNGIAYRRWLCQANPRLCGFVEQLIGSGFKNNVKELERLKEFENDQSVIAELAKIKRNNKLDLIKYIEEANGVKIDPDSIFDVQIKRLHEYKRQLLDVLHILHLFIKVKEGQCKDMQPRTFIFAAKASPGYVMAKQIIRLICSAANLINNDPVAREKLRVIFLADYKVSLAELIIPAAELSEQISLAGKEASGTGNMKLMINGALTIGTMDGANVEIYEQVGADNMFLFGLSANEVTELWQRGYNPQSWYNENHDIKAVVDMLKSNIFGHNFEDVARSLLHGVYGSADSYMCLADFASYADAQRRVDEAYRDSARWGRMSINNIAGAYVFSSDRAVQTYCSDIWKLRRITN